MRSLALAFSIVVLSTLGIKTLKPKKVDDSEEVQISNVTYSDFSKKEQKEIDCLAQVIYYEARGEQYRGRVAVAFVAMNRYKHQNYPDTMCKVVRQKSKDVCQFSWVCEKDIPPIRKSDTIYKKIVDLATEVYVHHDSMEDPTNGSLFFHSKDVSPNWKYKRSTQIGNHVFYKS